MKKYKVEWMNIVTFSCAHEVMAENEVEAIKLVLGMESTAWDYRDECDSTDDQVEVTLVEE